MKMKKIIFSLAVLFLALPGFSQQPDPESRAKDLTKKMKEIIQFSDEQVKSVYDLNLDFVKKRREVFQNRTEDREAKKAKMTQINAEYDASLKKILNEDQFKKYLEEKENIKARRERQGQGSPAGQGRPAGPGAGRK
jgi:hypothetical protein